MSSIWGITYPPQSGIPTQWPSSGGCWWQCGTGEAGTQAGPVGWGMKARASWAAAGQCHSQTCTCCSTRAPWSSGSLPHVWHCPASACQGERSNSVGQTSSTVRGKTYRQVIGTLSDRFAQKINTIFTWRIYYILYKTKFHLKSLIRS